MRESLVRLALTNGWHPDVIAKALRITPRHVRRVRAAMIEEEKAVRRDSKQLRELLAG